MSEPYTKGAELQAAKAIKNNGRSLQVGGTAGLADLTRRGMRLLCELDAILPINTALISQRSPHGKARFAFSAVIHRLPKSPTRVFRRCKPTELRNYHRRIPFNLSDGWIRPFNSTRFQSPSARITLASRL